MKEKEIAAFVKPLYSGKDKKHDFGHILRVRRNLRRLLKAAGKEKYSEVDNRLLYFILYFHGLKNWVDNNKEKIIELGYSDDDVQSLLRHSSNPQKEEEKLVYDANLLDNVGTAGIRKALYVGKTLGRSRKDTIKFLEENITKTKFCTPEGNKIGMKKIDDIKSFVNRNAK